MSSGPQIVIIHALRRALGLTEEAYRDMLKDNFGKESSKDLTHAEAAELIKGMQAKINGPGPGAEPAKKWDHLGARPGMATPAQLRMVEAMWKDVSRVEKPKERSEALREFLHSRFHVGALLWLEAADVRKVVKALKEMKWQKAKEQRELRRGVGT